jgi:hypothetical protein
MVLLVAGPVSATPYYWDTNDVTAGSGAATGTWDTIAGGTGSSFWSTDSTGSSATSSITTTATDDVTFSAGTNGTTGVVTVAGTQAVNTLTINQAGLTLSGGTIDLSGGATGKITVNSNTTINSVLKAKTVTIATNTTLILTGGSGGGTFFDGSNINGANNAVLDLQAGTYSIANTKNLTLGGGTQAGGATTLKVSGASLTFGSAGGLNVGRSGAGDGHFILNSGTVTANGASNDPDFRVGFTGAVGVVDINGGTLTGNGFMSINDRGNGASGSTGNTVNINGGTVTLGSILLGGSNFGTNSSSGSALVNLTAGALYLGTTSTAVLGAPNSSVIPNGIVNLGTGTSTYTITLSGGTLGATADWSSSVNMVLGGSSSGFFIKAADGSGSPVAHNITLSGILSNKLSTNSGFTKTGGGVLTLTGANTYTGGTIVSAGTAATGATGTFGAGDVTVGAGATLTLGNNTSIADAANLVFDTTLGTTINLSFSGTETINTLSSVSGTFATAGIDYDATTLNGIFGGTYFTGSGLLTIASSGIPEPSTYALWLSGVAGLVVMARRRQKRQK